MEHGLLRETEGVISVAVELPRGQSTEVADPGKRDRDKTIEELPHAVAAQRDVRADRLARAQLELRDGPAGSGDLGLLPGDGRQVAHGPLDHLGVMSGLAHAHVDDHLDNAPDLHDVAVLELLAQRRAHVPGVPGLQSGGDRGGHAGSLRTHSHRSSPDFLA